MAHRGLQQVRRRAGGTAMTDPFEQGYELSKQEPDLMLIEVWRRAPEGFSKGPAWERADQEAFLMGYIAMRRQRDAREQESHHQSASDSNRDRQEHSDVHTGDRDRH